MASEVKKILTDLDLNGNRILNALELDIYSQYLLYVNSSNISNPLTFEEFCSKISYHVTELNSLLSSKQDKRSISILFVGNSLTQDGIAYLPYMLKTYYPEIDFKIYMWYIGGYTLGQHYSVFESAGKASIFSVAENSSKWTNYSNSKTMSSILSTYKFDIVCLQEYFNYKTSYTKATDWILCRDYIVSNYKGGNALEFISLFHAPLRKDGYDVHEVYKKIEEGNALILTDTNSEDIIPNGIAVYRALDTELNSLGDLGQLSPDGTHTQEGLPCLLQTYVTLCWLFDRLSINKSIYGHPMRMTTEIYNSISVPGANLGTGVIVGTDEQNLLAQELAIKAYKEGIQFKIKNISTYEFGSNVMPILQCTITITSNIDNAIIKINGIEQNTATLLAGSSVHWEVSCDGYITQSGVEVLSADMNKHIELMPVIDVIGLTVEYTQGNYTIFSNITLDELKRKLTVTAQYEDGTISEIDSYELTGSLDPGLNLMTVSFGGKTDTFELEVTEFNIPSDYSRYGYIQTKANSKLGTNSLWSPSNFIYLNAYEDMNSLSTEVILGEKPNLSMAAPGIMGARLSEGTGTPYYGIYLKEAGIWCAFRDTEITVNYPEDRSKYKVTIDNSTSPTVITVNDGETSISKNWSEGHRVIPYGMSLFNNIPHATNAGMNICYSIRIGDIILREADGNCVGYYVPVIYGNQIGMYDVVSKSFCTSENTDATQYGGSSCKYSVGNW